MDADLPHPLLVPMGDAAMLVRFATQLSDPANRAALAMARRVAASPPDGVIEIDTTLVSVLVRYDPLKTDAARIAGELRLLVSTTDEEPVANGAALDIDVAFGGDAGPDLCEVAALIGLPPAEFIARHNARPLRVLAVGFAPGFIYCGFHPDEMRVPRRQTVRRQVPAGTVLFAAGQTAITATPIPTGWHVIGRTDFANFNPDADPPTRLADGDHISFRALA